MIELSKLQQAKIKAFEREAEAIELHLYGQGAKMLSKSQRQGLKASLEDVHTDMAKFINSLSSKALEEQEHER